MSTFVPIDFELGVPVVRAWSPDDEAVEAEDQITLQFERAATGAKYRCFVNYALMEVFVAASFGAPAPTPDTGFSCKDSEFCRFFVSHAALEVIRQLVASINQSRTQTISFERVVEPDPDGAPDEVMPPGFLATWSIDINEVRHQLTAYIPAAEFDARAGERAAAGAGASGNEDDVWQASMRTSLASAEVQLRAIMNRPHMPLEELSNLKVGDVVEFVDARSAAVVLECDGEPLFICEIGQKDGQFAVNVVTEVGNGNAPPPL